MTVDEEPVMETVDAFCHTQDCGNSALVLVTQGMEPCIRVERVKGGRVACGVCGLDITDIHAVPGSPA